MSASPALYLYRLIMEGRAQVGVVGCVHVDDYEHGVIKKHETTRPDKEDDRTRHILALERAPRAGAARLPRESEIARLGTEATERPPLYDFTGVGGVRHTVWAVADPAPYVDAFGDVRVRLCRRWPSPLGQRLAGRACRAAVMAPAMGRRRSGGGSRRCSSPRSSSGSCRTTAWWPISAGQSPAEVLRKLEAVGRLSATTTRVPPRSGSFCVYLGRRWYLLELTESSIDRGDPRRSLDVTLVHERVLGPVLGVGDPRTDERIDFVGGLRGPGELEARVDSGRAALAVSLYPTSIEQLMIVSDAGHVMPPKSTWFEPKLASGLFVHPFA